MFPDKVCAKGKCPCYTKGIACKNCLCRHCHNPFGPRKHSTSAPALPAEGEITEQASSEAAEPVEGEVTDIKSEAAELEGETTEHVEGETTAHVKSEAAELIKSESTEHIKTETVETAES